MLIYNCNAAPFQQNHLSSSINTIILKVKNILYDRQEFNKIYETDEFL